MAGLAAGGVAAFGRWRRAPLYEVAVPGVRLVGHRLAAAGPVGASLAARRRTRLRRPPPAGVGRSRAARGRARLATRRRSQRRSCTTGRAGTVSIVVPVQGAGFPVASLREQDGLLAGWGAALAPLARARCPVVAGDVAGVDASRPASPATASSSPPSTGPTPHQPAPDYDELLDVQAPLTIAHEVLVTVTVDLRRIHGRAAPRRWPRRSTCWPTRPACWSAGWSRPGCRWVAPLSPLELSTAIRLRSDPSRAGQLDGLSPLAGRRRRAGDVGVGTDGRRGGLVPRPGRRRRCIARIGSAAWPMLPVAADWLAPLLTADGATRTVTVVLEPVPLARAAADANRQLTSIEADHAQKERHGFRLTARERRRQADVEGRERELAEGHPEFRHVGIVTVTAADLDELDDAAGRVEQAAAQSMLDLRPLAARQAEGWVASLPVGRSVRPGNWP